MYDCDEEIVTEIKQSQTPQTKISVAKPKPVATVKTVKRTNKKILVNKPIRYEVVKTITKPSVAKPKINKDVKPKPAIQKILNKPKTKIVHTRIVRADSKNYNKLYDV